MNVVMEERILAGPTVLLTDICCFYISLKTAWTQKELHSCSLPNVNQVKSWWITIQTNGDFRLQPKDGAQTPTQWLELSILSMCTEALKATDAWRLLHTETGKDKLRVITRLMGESENILISMQSGKLGSDLKWAPKKRRAVHLWSDHPGHIAGLNRA